MTENKRFMIIGENYTNIDMPVFVVCRENDCCFEVYESKEEAQRVCDKLNNLLDENKTLKEENEQLKFQNSNLMKEVAEYSRKTKELDNENKNLKDLLKSMADRNNEIWLDDGRIIRLNKIFKGEWI